MAKTTLSIAVLSVVFALASESQKKYAHEMHDPAGPDPIFYYCIEVQDREFCIILTADDLSHWDDHTGRRKIRSPHRQHLELSALMGNEEALRFLQNEIAEFTVTIRTPEKIVLKAQSMAKKQKIDDSDSDILQEDITWETANDITEMDQLLREFFWQEVNPLLSQPIDSPK